MDSEEALLSRVRDRDSEALAMFLEQNARRMTGFVKSICSDRLLGVVELEDLLQEISTAALTSLDTAPFDKYEPIEWIQQIARRRVVDAHRFHFEAQRRDVGRQQSMHGQADSSAGGIEAMIVASITSPSAAMSRDVRMERMQEAVAKLSEDQQQAIRMRYAEGLPTKEIAEKLGKTDVAIRVLLSRSMKELEKQLEDVRPTAR